MREDILARLALINEEEQKILEGENKVNKRLYSAFAKEFIVNTNSKTTRNDHHFVERFDIQTDQSLLFLVESIL